MPLAALISVKSLDTTPSSCLVNEYYGYSARLKLVPLASGPSAPSIGHSSTPHGPFKGPLSVTVSVAGGWGSGPLMGGSGPLAQQLGWGGTATGKDDGGSPEVPYAGWVLVV
jgi:hypothetical protein